MDPNKEYLKDPPGLGGQPACWKKVVAAGFLLWSGVPEAWLWVSVRSAIKLDGPIFGLLWGSHAGLGGIPSPPPIGFQGSLLLPRSESPTLSLGQWCPILRRLWDLHFAVHTVGPFDL